MNWQRDIKSGITLKMGDITYIMFQKTASLQHHIPQSYLLAVCSRARTVSALALCSEQSVVWNVIGPTCNDEPGQSSKVAFQTTSQFRGLSRLASGFTSVACRSSFRPLQFTTLNPPATSPTNIKYWNDVGPASYTDRQTDRQIFYWQKRKVITDLFVIEMKEIYVHVYTRLLVC